MWWFVGSHQEFLGTGLEVGCLEKGLGLIEKWLR